MARNGGLKPVEPVGHAMYVVEETHFGDVHCAVAVRFVDAAVAQHEETLRDLVLGDDEFGAVEEFALGHCGDLFYALHREAAP